MVGAGLAGLACARHLHAHGVDVTLHEASDGVGGRVRTDRVDGMLLDRGFQVHNTGYPEAQRVLDHDALDLKPFAAGALVRLGDRLHRVGDPRRRPLWALSTLRAPIGSPLDKLVVARLAATAAVPRASTLLARPETTAYDGLRGRGLSDAVIDRFLRPFLSGVFLDADLETSSRFLDLVWRSFARGTQCVPAGGMGAIPQQLSHGLDVRLDSPVARLDRKQTTVVATDPVTAGKLLPGLEIPVMKRVTTHYHLAPEAPVHEAAVVLDGERSGPVVNTVVLTQAAPSYAPGRTLVSSSVLAPGVGEPEVRAHLSRIYGVDTARWESVAAYDLPAALPSQAPPMGRFRKPVRVDDRLYVCGDHRDSASIQGALVSGRRAAEAVLADVRSIS